MRGRLLFFVITVGAAGCTAVTAPGVSPGTYLEIEYVNHAWVPTWRGVVIDSTGAVQGWDLGGQRWEAADETYVPAAVLREKWQHDTSLEGDVSAATFRELAALVTPAAGAALSEPQNRCADAGTVTYTAWRYDPVRSAFRRIVVRREGDIAQQSTAPAGAELGERLAGLELMPRFEGCAP